MYSPLHGLTMAQAHADSQDVEVDNDLDDLPTTTTMTTMVTPSPHHPYQDPQDPSAPVSAPVINTENVNTTVPSSTYVPPSTQGGISTTGGGLINIPEEGNDDESVESAYSSAQTNPQAQQFQDILNSLIETGLDRKAAERRAKAEAEGNKPLTTEEIEERDRNRAASVATQMDNPSQKLAEPFIESTQWGTMAATGTTKEDLNSAASHIPGYLGFVPKYLGSGPVGKLKGNTYWDESAYLDIRSPNPADLITYPSLQLDSVSRKRQREAMTYRRTNIPRLGYGNIGYSRIRHL